MHIDYSKRKSYQRIVAKAKSYSPKGDNSLLSQRNRMRTRRNDFKTMMDAGIIKTTKEGVKELEEIQKAKGVGGAITMRNKFLKYNEDQKNIIRDIADRTVTDPKKRKYLPMILKASGDGKAYTPPPISKIRDDQRGLYDIAKDTYNRVNNLRKQYGVSANLLTGEITKSGQLKGFNYRVDTDLFGRDKKVNVSFQKDF
tara:strand:- start:380 stop:976 length:597 start_codon:yes stop_codon:yes gene_type:complete